MSQFLSRNSNSFNQSCIAISVSNYFTFADGRSDPLPWLSPLDPKSRHQDIQDDRVEHIGGWLLQTEEFRRWHAGSREGGSDDAVLFCYGDPGVGKTYISSLVIDTLCDQARGEYAVAYLYLDFAAQQEQSSTNMLGALLKQLVFGLGEIPAELAQAYEELKSSIGERRPQQTDIVKMLQTASSKKRTFICIDALDECVPKHRVSLLNSLNTILQKSSGTRIFLTGRPHIRPELERRLSERVTSLSISTKRADIIQYLQNRLEGDTTSDAMDSSLEADILKKIPEDISEIFLLVSLNINAVLQETTIYRRRQKLSAMTNGLELGDAYSATLGRIKGQEGGGSELGMAALMWISQAERPLKADELCHALAVEIGSPNLNIDNIPSTSTLLTCCQGLVVVEKEASTVRLIHVTLQEYLRAHPDLFRAAHSTIAETCLSYLNSRQVKALSISASPDLQDTPFLEYSSLYWGVHARRGTSDFVKQLAEKLFDGCDRHISTKILLEAQEMYWYAMDFDKPSLFSGLHCASFFGISEIVAGLVEMEGCGINQMDFTGNTPLHWAAWGGHERTVKTLLRRDSLGPDKPDNSGRIPLHHAARRGYEGVVKILLERDRVNPDIPDNNGRTPLWWAASNGCEGVVKMLLERGDVNPGKPNKDGQTPLWWAAFNGHEGTVKILLERGEANPDKSDSFGRTPLFIAACYGQEGVVKMLLGRSDVNPNKPDNDGQTPLWWAARNGHEGVVKMLLKQGEVDPDKPDSIGRTPLFIATCYGEEGVVKALLGGGVNSDKPNINGRTPLYLAAWNGKEEMVKILLKRDDVNPNKSDKDGKTPLDRATEEGHQGVIALLQPAIRARGYCPPTAFKYG